MFLVVVGTAHPIWTYKSFLFPKVCLVVVGTIGGFFQGLPPRAAEALLDNILPADIERQYPWHLSDDETESYHLSLLYNWHVYPLFCTLCCVLVNEEQ